MKKEIYYGDNLDILRKHIDKESIDLCYIDPPFNSKRNYNQIYNNVGSEDKASERAFIDTWTWDDMAIAGLEEIKYTHTHLFSAQSVDLISGLEKVLGKGSLFAYLVSMTLRINEIHRVLKNNGTFYLHCDKTAAHYLKLILDAVFCPKGGIFLNEIIWTYDSAGRGTKKFHNKHDNIFWYAKNAKKWTFNGRVKDVGVEREASNHMRVGEDEKGKFYEKTDKASGKVYRWYLNDRKIRNDWWNDIIAFERQPADVIYINALNREDKERLGYDTQKPEGLLERIIKASSNEGDLILDAYCGCGTTLSVAEKLNRQWIGIDITYRSISLILKRLEEQNNSILDTIKINGVPKDFESALALANKTDDRTRKEFEKWMIQTYSKNRAIVNEKKGGDKGIDGIAYIPHNQERENKKVLFSVKSSKTLTPAVIRELNGAIEREEAACGILLTLYPMPNLVKDCKQYGNYYNEFTGNDYPKIQIICVEDIFNGKTIELPNIVNVVKKAEQYLGKQTTML